MYVRMYVLHVLCLCRCTVFMSHVFVHVPYIPHGGYVRKQQQQCLLMHIRIS